ncbi:MAG TPA: PAS domain S-box protein, partial [Verrucomicrobiae bacterium]|nr:PAS domain S-box protein [Verrucomicrobiae bacterium]
ARAKAELVEARKSIANFGETCPVGTLILDQRGIIEEINPAAARLLGFSRRQLLKQSLTVFIAGQDRERLLDHLSQRRTRPQCVELQLAHKSREPVYVELVTFSPPGIRPKRFHGALIDVTARHRAEAGLQRLAAIIESSDDAIVSKDLNTIINSWNSGAERIFGYKAQEIIGKPVTTLIPPDRLPEEIEILERIRRGDRVQHYETVRRRKDGRLIDVSLTISPVKDASGTIIGASKVARDITDRKRVETRQQAIYEFVQSVNRPVELPEIFNMAVNTLIKLQNADRAAVLLSDPDGVMRFKASRGLSPGYRIAVEGHSPWEKACSDFPPVLIENIERAALSEELRQVVKSEGIRAMAFIPIAFERQLLGKFMIYYDTPHRFTPEEIQPAQTVAIQIAFAIERKRAETVLKQANDEAERANRAKDNFLATLSHELRTPLNPVLLLASDAAVNRELPPRVRADFDAIRKNIELEARLIDDLLDLTRLSRGKFKLEKRLIDIHTVLENAIATVRNEAEQKAIALVTELRADGATVLGDDVRLQQVFWNILKNAVKFTPERGQVLVQTKTMGDSRFQLTVSDTGIGIDPAELPGIFEAFSQGAHSGFGGLGLGLAISRSLVEQHDGRISARSGGKGRGAVFTIELPLARQVAAERSEPVPAPVPAPKSNARNIRILLVEDHEPTRVALTHLLARRNHKVISAASASEAWAVVEKEHSNFDLVISDIGLPDASGYDLMSGLKKKCGLRGIALTGYGMEQDIHRSLESGFVAHLTKPVRMENLDNALGAVLLQNRPAR